MAQKISKIYRCSQCKSSNLKEIIEGNASVVVTRIWENGSIKKKDFQYKNIRRRNLKLICEKCNKEFTSYNELHELLPEINIGHIEKRLINWLKNYFSEKPLPLPWKNVGDEEISSEKIFEICFPCLGHYEERWFLNKNGERGRHVQIQPSRREIDGLYIIVEVKEEKDRVWEFYIEELAVSAPGGAGQGCTGKISYDEKTNEFKFKSIDSFTIINKYKQ